MKKIDSKGKILPEVIGEGLDLNHIQKVKEARKNSELIRFRCPKGLKEAFQHIIKEDGLMNESETLRALIEAYINRQIKIK